MHNANRTDLLNTRPVIIQCTGSDIPKSKLSQFGFPIVRIINLCDIYRIGRTKWTLQFPLGESFTTCWRKTDVNHVRKFWIESSGREVKEHNCPFCGPLIQSLNRCFCIYRGIIIWSITPGSEFKFLNQQPVVKKSYFVILYCIRDVKQTLEQNYTFKLYKFPFLDNTKR